MVGDGKEKDTLLATHAGNTLHTHPHPHTLFSHQSLVPEITPRESERVALNSARYASFVLSNLLVLSSMFGLISGLGDTNPLTYKALTGIVLGTGAVCATIFLAVVRTPPSGNAGAESSSPTPTATSKAGGGKGVYDWLKDPNLYKTAVVYITMRIASNLTTLYMALFLVQTLGMDPTTIASIPFVIFASSLLTVSGLKRLTERVGVRGTLTLGAAVFACGGVGILSVQRGPQANAMFAVAAALGIGLAGLTVSTATLQSELLGEDTLSAGFVFGIMSAVDNLVVGLLVFGLHLASDSLSQQQQL
jgi:Na+/melibiose symporter-like transporter